MYIAEIIAKRFLACAQYLQSEPDIFNCFSIANKDCLHARLHIQT